MNKITFISTKKINPGDEFILKGIFNLLKYNQNSNHTILNKHKPFIETKIFNNKGEYRLNWRITKYLILLMNILSNLVNRNELKAKTVIHAGQPFFYRFKSYFFKITTFNSLWYLNFYRFKSFSKNTKLFLIALGTTVYSEEQFNSILNSKSFINKVKKLGDRANLITTRDLKTKLIFDKAGIDSEYLPCTAFFSASEKNLNDKNEYILLNFMKNGSNSYKELDTDQTKWEKEIITMVSKLENQSIPIKFISHSLEDYYFQKKLFPNYENFYSDNSEEFYKIYEDSVGGIFNRIHGAFLSLSNLKPTICINQDSRIEMFKILNVKTFKTSEITADEVVSSFINLIDNYSTNKDNLMELKTKYKSRYISLFENKL